MSANDNNFTEQEQQVLEMMFRMFSEVLSTCEYIMVNTEPFDRNNLYTLREKLGIEDQY